MVVMMVIKIMVVVVVVMIMVMVMITMMMIWPSGLTGSQAVSQRPPTAKARVRSYAKF